MISGSGLSLYSDKSPARYPSDISICIFTLNIITGIITEGFCLLDYGQIALQRNPPGLWQKNNGLMVLSSRQAVSSIINMQFFMHFPSSPHTGGGHYWPPPVLFFSNVFALPFTLADRSTMISSCRTSV